MTSMNREDMEAKLIDWRRDWNPDTIKSWTLPQLKEIYLREQKALRDEILKLYKHA